MNSVERIEYEVKGAFEQADLSKWVIWDRSQFLDIGSRTFIEIVLSDASQISAAMQVFVALARNPDLGPYEFLVRAVWKLKHVGEPQLARTPDGGIVAATVIPVVVESDREQQVVNVLISLDAEMSFTRILGQKPDLREIATVVVGNALSRGGTSSWDPRVRPRFEVTAHLAADLSRQLARAA